MASIHIKALRTRLRPRTIIPNHTQRRNSASRTRARSQEPAAMPHNFGISASTDIDAVVAFSAPRSANAAQSAPTIRTGTSRVGMSWSLKIGQVAKVHSAG